MKRQFVVVAALIAVTTASIFADTLVLTNGRRVPGELVGVQRREIEFEERGSRRILRIPRDEISRIEFEDDRSFERDDFSGGGGVPRGMRERQIGVDARAPWYNYQALGAHDGPNREVRCKTGAVPPL